MSSRKVILSLIFIGIAIVVIWKIKTHYWPAQATQYVEKKFKQTVSDIESSLPAEAEPTTLPDLEEWTQTHSTPGPNGTIREWFIPNAKSGPTDTFRMAGCNTGFRAWGNDCLVEYKSSSSDKTTLVYLNVAKNIFYQAPKGIISDRQYPEEEFAAIRKDAESVRFLEVKGKPLNIKAWRTE